MTQHNEPDNRPPAGLTLRKRLLLGTGVMLIPLLILAFYSKYFIAGTLDEFDKVIDKIEQEVTNLAHLQILLLKAPMPANDYLIHGGKTELSNFDTLKEQIDLAFNQAISVYTPEPGILEILETSRGSWEEAKKNSYDIFRLKKEGTDAPLPLLMEELDEQLETIAQTLGRAIALSRISIESSYANVNSARQQTKILTFVIVGSGLVTSVIAALILAWTIHAPINKIKEGAANLGSGNLSYRINYKSDDELGELSRVFNQMADMLEEDQKMLQQQAIRDDLTGLFNRREFQRRLDDEIKRSVRYQRPFSIIMLDIDHFKNVNDTYGHLAGDRVLRELAYRLTNIVRPMDSVMRYGGEEFTIILPETALNNARSMAERIRAYMEEHDFPLENQQNIQLTVSIGVAELGKDYIPGTDLLIKVDEALYAAKNAGRNRVFVAEQYFTNA